ncbi:galactose oxidase, partial [Hesseltinella vesiculosa]
MQSISGIVTQTHSTKGDIPPPLVGSSISVVGDQVFVFAGRLVTSRKMTNHLYVLDLKSLVWSRHIPPPDSEKAPKPRYFHSVNVYGRLLVVFGGMGYSRQSADGLCVLDDVAIFNINTMTWKQPAIQPSLFAPRPRYAHLATISAGQLLVVGGQDMNNGYLSESNVLDLESLEWVKATTFEQHVGAYRSVAVATPSEVLHLSGLSSEAQLLADKPGPIFLYSNHNFANVNRDLKIITEATHSTVDDAPIGKRNHHLSIDDISHMMTGSIMPPGLRFPTGDCIGQHIVIAGTYLSPQSQSYSIWGLNTATLTWTRVDTGSIFTQGSWNRGILYAKQNRYLVFGNSSRNLLEDYNHRQINFDHLAMVDLESFGIYQHPPSNCAQLAQEMGLRLLDEPSIADFYILTRENQEIPVNSAVIRYRWPYFAKILDEARNADQYISDELSMVFPYPYPVVVAFLQFLYTDSLLTAQQYQPHILSQLLLLGDMYSLPRLVSLSRHALHQMLNMSTAPLIFETAALSHQISLQIRALKLMIAAKKMIQHQ